MIKLNDPQLLRQDCRTGGASGDHRPWSIRPWSIRVATCSSEVVRG
ncbi:hypothetical protein [Thioclava sp. GXIMD4216]